MQSRSVTQSTCIQSLQRIAPGGITADIITLILPDLISANDKGRDKMTFCPWVCVGHRAQSQVVKSCNRLTLHNSVGFEDSLDPPIVIALQVMVSGTTSPSG